MDQHIQQRNYWPQSDFTHQYRTGVRYLPFDHPLFDRRAVQRFMARERDHIAVTRESSADAQHKQRTYERLRSFVGSDCEFEFYVKLASQEVTLSEVATALGVHRSTVGRRWKQYLRTLAKVCPVTPESTATAHVGLRAA